MTLVEFVASWKGNYSKEQEESYTIMYGEDRSRWPETDDESPITIDLERVCRFNPHHDHGKTTVEIAGGPSFSLCIEYSLFQKIISKNIGKAIMSYTETRNTQ